MVRKVRRSIPKRSSKRPRRVNRRAPSGITMMGVPSARQLVQSFHGSVTVKPKEGSQLQSLVGQISSALDPIRAMDPLRARVTRRVGRPKKRSRGVAFTPRGAGKRR